MEQNNILVFGLGELQESIILQAKSYGLFVVGIDPCADPYCKQLVDVFEVVAGDDYNKTLEIANKYNISAVITAATDKPLVMMAKIAEKLNLHFISVETAIVSTDKFLMKEYFMKNEIPCAKGKLISNIEDLNNLEEFSYPVIIKPRDNSGSRGVKLCNDKLELEQNLKEVFQYTKKETVLIEEFIEGKEYSIESLHYDNKSKVVQFTEKKVTQFPYNVELGHIQPAGLSEQQKTDIEKLIEKIGSALNFNNCASHTELKINNRGIFIIETSPRLGGDFITSKLVPLSTGINIEKCLIDISLGKKPVLDYLNNNKSSGVRFFSIKGQKIEDIDKNIVDVHNWDFIKHFSFKLKKGDVIPKITSSLSRYGEFIIQTDTREQTIALLDKYEDDINKLIIGK